MRTLFIVVVALLLPAPVGAQSPILERALDLANGAALVAHAADYGSTVRCTTARTCIEGNKWAAPYVHGDNPQQVKYFLAKWGTAFASYYVKTRTKRRAPWVTLAVAGAETTAFLLIAKHNHDVHVSAMRGSR